MPSATLRNSTKDFMPLPTIHVLGIPSSCTHADAWTGISFGVDLVCDVIDGEGEDDRVGLCFREIGLGVMLEDVDGSYAGTRLSRQEGIFWGYGME
mmetsp:Transcript_15558/g.45014  ORF Transcript_15558/g.45014 Transcript_15558/m.45014 type:complete len:96 (-) Transcript_15558:216-503(-)|eukprot:CAMPEP_0181058234 /NCGR_PEP_ID=MMETSP1070-20121207/20699_1 /TAXON_ID=265543 /ORGANISM="Minutocellus polymorphus, Strain NH13" /LENGTH=95 /DNA_ID=CAMNT_0023137749 /DNA_START=456 /DNA_END=743 /DNA_ORIENTATION=+